MTSYTPPPQQENSQALHLVHKRDIVRLGRSLIACHCRNSERPDQNSGFKAASAKIVEADVIDPEAREAITIFGTVDVVVNNARSIIVVTLKRYHMRSGAGSKHIRTGSLFDPSINTGP